MKLEEGLRFSTWNSFIGGTFLLLLSMYHCTESLMLFGLPWYMAFAYAFGIDWGLVSLEIGQLFSSDVEI